MIERIRDYIFYYVSDIESKEDLTRVVEMFRNFTNRFKKLYQNFDQDSAYRELKKFLRTLLDEETVNEVMEEVKKLDKGQLRDFIFALMEELQNTVNDMEADLEKFEEWGE